MKSNSTKAYYYVPGVLLLALITGGCVSSSAYKTLEDQYKQSEARALELETANKDLNERIAELTEEIEAKDAEIKSMTEATADGNGSGEDMSALLQEKAALERELANLRAGQRSMDLTFNGLSGALKKELEDGNIKISQVQGMVRLTVEDGVFFNSGSTAINQSGRDLLNRLADALKDSPEHSLIIEGYTDSRRIGPKLRRKYATNWDLGAARAINVVRYLSDEGGIDVNRLSAQTFGDSQASGDNSTSDGRASNRRIQISVVQQQKVDESTEIPTKENVDEMVKEEMDKAEEEATEEATNEINEAIEPIEEVKTETEESEEMEKSEDTEEKSEEMEADQPAENTP